MPSQLFGPSEVFCLILWSHDPDQKSYGHKIHILRQFSDLMANQKVYRVKNWMKNQSWVFSGYLISRKIVFTIYLKIIGKIRQKTKDLYLRKKGLARLNWSIFVDLYGVDQTHLCWTDTFVVSIWHNCAELTHLC